MPEYRPCIITERKNKILPSRNEKCPIDIEHETVTHNALFHQWYQKFWTVDPIMRGQVGGQMSITVAIVEYEDGTIHEHIPQEIQFTDGMVQKNFLNKKDEWNRLTKDMDEKWPERE